MDKLNIGIAGLGNVGSALIETIEENKIYFLDKLPSGINIISIIIIFLISLSISAIASYLPAMRISKMSTFRALRYE